MESRCPRSSRGQTVSVRNILSLRERVEKSELTFLSDFLKYHLKIHFLELDVSKPSELKSSLTQCMVYLS